MLHYFFVAGAIKRRVELEHFTEDREYLSLLRKHLEGALNEFTPDILVYNAGTDILDRDPLGVLSVSAQVRTGVPGLVHVMYDSLKV